MTPTQGTSRMQTTSKGGKVERTPRCEHTMLTKPECHCQACLMAQIAAHGSLSTRRLTAAQPGRKFAAPGPVGRKKVGDPTRAGAEADATRKAPT